MCNAHMKYDAIKKRTVHMMQQGTGNGTAAQITTLNIRLVKTPLPATVKGATGRSRSGAHTVVINSDLTEAEQAAAFTHEMLHIWYGDFDSMAPAEQVERQRHAAPTAGKKTGYE